jgi:YbgC/YbaW family acyl-CoA thioester hydrolase
MPYEHTSTRKVEFSETDMAGLVHFSNFFKYMETAERDFFEACRSGPDPHRARRTRRLARGRGRSANFSAPLRFGDTIDIHLAVKSVKDRAIDYQFRIFRRNEDGSRTQAGKGHMTTILAKLNEGGELQSAELSDDLRKRITEAPAEVLKRAESI